LSIRRSIRNGVAYLLALALILTGSLKRARKRAFAPGVITSIALHNPDAKLFQKLVFWLHKNGFVFISTEQLLDILHNQTDCPRGAVWLSLDDGWQGNVTGVVPIAVERHVPVTIFITTGAVEDGTFWWRKVQQSPDLVPAGLRNVEELKNQPEATRAEIIRTIDESGQSLPREAMTIDEIKEISQIPHITLGAHTETHPILPNCTDMQLKQELTESKRKLEEWTGRSVTAFTYPNGSFNGREKQYLEKLGYTLAATTEEMPASIKSDPYFFPRHVIMDDGSLAEGLCHALGVWAPVISKVKRFI
jgi:peptidoglycan/xylan/chitin deacetylase (PgdA/CDA1 family)